MVKTIKEIETLKKKKSYSTNVIKEPYIVKDSKTELAVINIAFIFSFILLPLVFIIAALIVF